MVKPDATSKGYTGAILDQIIKAGFSIKTTKWIKLTAEQAGEFYAYGGIAGRLTGNRCG